MLSLSQWLLQAGITTFCVLNVMAVDQGFSDAEGFAMSLAGAVVWPMTWLVGIVAFLARNQKSC